MHYIDTNLYRYFIGRNDQSVNEKVMMGRIDQQLLVTRILIDLYNLSDIKNVRLKKYLASYLAIMMTVSTCLLYKIGDDVSLQKKKDLWKYLKNNNKEAYKMVKFSVLGMGCNIKGKIGRNITLKGYKFANFLFGFN